MIQIKKFTFNPFQENTYLLINENNECIVVDPGCLVTDLTDLFVVHVADDESVFNSSLGLKLVEWIIRVVSDFANVEFLFG